MRKIAVILLCACAVAACRPKEVVTKTKSTTVHTTVIPENEAKKKVREVIQPLPAPIEKSLLGDKVGPDGVVSHETDHFTAGQPVYFTLRLHDSPVGLKTSATWSGPGQKEIHTEQREMNGAKTATFAMTSKLPPGKYNVEGHWGGNLAGEKTFEVVAPPAKKKR
jgi:hypothetical protein